MAIAAKNLDIRRGIKLSKNFASHSGAGNDGVFTRNDASSCVQRFRDEKISRDIAGADVFFKCGGDWIVAVWFHARRRIRTISAKCERVYERRIIERAARRSSSSRHAHMQHKETTLNRQPVGRSDLIRKKRFRQRALMTDT